MRFGTWLASTTSHSASLGRYRILEIWGANGNKTESQHRGNCVGRSVSLAYHSQGSWRSSAFVLVISHSTSAHFDCSTRLTLISISCMSPAPCCGRFWINFRPYWSTEVQKCCLPNLEVETQWSKFDLLDKVHCAIGEVGRRKVWHKKSRDKKSKDKCTSHWKSRNYDYQRRNRLERRMLPVVGGRLVCGWLRESGGVLSEKKTSRVCPLIMDPDQD